MCEAMAKAQKTYSLTDDESAYLVYKWLDENIVYDCYALNHGGIDYSEDGTYYKGKGVCSGYAMIYVTLGLALGLETEYVIGYSKGAGFVLGRIPTHRFRYINSSLRRCSKASTKFIILSKTF